MAIGRQENNVAFRLAAAGTAALISGPPCRRPLNNTTLLI
jgi:hypothetical protein